MDLKNREYYAFDNKGHLLRAFGHQGEGPGQVRNIGGASLWVIKNRVLIEDPDKIHHFDDQGQYLTSIRKTRTVSLFLTENEYISAPASISGLPSDQAMMRYVNLETGQETVIANFTVFNSGVLRTSRGTANLIMPSISGVAVISIVKKKYPKIPVIAITGYGEHPEALATEAHADLVLEKPFELPELDRIITDMLSSKSH